MSFPLSPEQDRLAEASAEFARTNLSLDYPERESRGEFSRQDWNRCAEFGFFHLLEGTPADAAARLEGLGYGCVDNGLLMSLHAHLWGCLLAVREFGDAPTQERYLSSLASGRWIGAHAASEAHSGSDFPGILTRAERQGDRFVLNGSKVCVTNAPVAEVTLVYARTSPDPGIRSISAFLVDRETPGVTVCAPSPRMGLRTSPIAEMRFEDCSIPESNLVGGLHNGSLVFNHAMRWERTFVVGTIVGSMRRILEMTVAQAKCRKIQGRAISELGAVRHRLVAMKTRLEASRLFFYRAAHALAPTHRDSESMLFSSLAKRYVSESYVATCQDAMAVFGARGQLIETGLERELRDAMASVVYSGTSDIQEDIVARLL